MSALSREVAVRTIATIASIGACAVAVLAAGGCDGLRSPDRTSPTATSTAASSGRRWVMPDLVGAGLQDAQDRIQALTSNVVFFTDSHDLSGRGRHQAVDENWKVCTQNIAPGATVSPTSKIDFGVVKLDETCP
ncbi:PASTA domain-containing protein [Actinophytocola sp.]|uniref:PASTA domain-containing protein n=1 Tax=Actinophytocola sp. TaxID=1872138 RepID=UPI00389A869D